jgi:hypothetical protein
MSVAYQSGVQLGIERLEERAVLTPPAGVTVAVVSNALVVHGDNHADQILVLQLGSGRYLVEVQPGVQINAGTGVQTLGSHAVIVSKGQTVNSVQVTLGSGDNRFAMLGVHDTGTFSLTGGNGTDRVTLAGNRIDGATTATLGTGNNGLVLVGNHFSDSFTATLGNAGSTAADRVAVVGSTFSKAFALTTGGGDDSVGLHGGTHVTGAATIDLGAGNDLVRLGLTRFDGDLTLDGGTGTNTGFGLPFVGGAYTPTNITHDYIHKRS